MPDDALERPDLDAQPDIAYEWHPIEALPEEEHENLARPELRIAIQQWRDERVLLKDQTKIAEFARQLATRWAIETGIIERLYDVDRGVTENLIAIGLEAAAQLHTSRLSRRVLDVIRDHEEALEFVFSFVKEERSLSTSYIKQLHQLLMRHQDRTEGIDHLGNKLSVPLVKGDWKQWPNNPVRTDGRIHEYCPPVQVASEMDRLVALYTAMTDANCPAEVTAAWVHHRFAQIHPFQDGNGRVARALATLVFVKAEFLPLVLTRDHRDQYLEALEFADMGELSVLVDLFTEIQLEDLQKEIEFVRTLRGAGVAKIITTAAERASQQEQEMLESILNQTQSLVDIAKVRFEEIKAEVEAAFARSQLDISALVFVSEELNEDWWSRQIIDVAKDMRYFANLHMPRRWVHLRLLPRTPGRAKASVVVSFHHKGSLRGLMVATSFVMFLSESSLEDASAHSVSEVFPACDEPFTYSLDHRNVDTSFRSWLEKSLEAALDYWQRNL